MKSTTCK